MEEQRILIQQYFRYERLGIRLNDRHINMNFDPGFLFPSDWPEALPPGLPLLDWNGAAWYNSLQTSLTKRMSKGLRMLVSYFKRT